MSLKDDVLAVEAYVVDHVNKAKAFIAKEVALVEAAVSASDTVAIGASLSNIKMALDNLQAVEVDPTPAPAPAALPAPAA